MEYLINPITAEDQEAIIDIFNYYIENSFAAYPEAKLPYQAFDILIKMSNGLPTASIKNQNGELLGFGMLRIYNPIPSFSHTAEISYFINREHTGKGLGKILLEFIEKEGKENGIKNILANISSLNTGSIRFHKNNGFIECGCFKNVGIKKGKTFDTIWMQKTL